MVIGGDNLWNDFNVRNNGNIFVKNHAVFAIDIEAMKKLGEI